MYLLSKGGEQILPKSSDQDEPFLHQMHKGINVIYTKCLTYE